MNLKIFFLKNKIVLFVFALIFAILFLIYSDYKANIINWAFLEKKEQNAHILVTKWNAIIKRWEIIKLSKQEKLDIKIGDKIRTFDNSAATIFWIDWSITRLWPKTALDIKELSYNKTTGQNKTKIDLVEWKTWSNIIKYLKEDSYFIETYDMWNYAATVRWTVFEINLDENYIYAVDHDISIEDIMNKKLHPIPQWESRNAHNIDTTVPKEILDLEWIEENLSLDKDYLLAKIEEWKKIINESLESEDFGTKLINNTKSQLWNNKTKAINSIKSYFKWENISLENIDKLIPLLNESDRNLLNKWLVNIYDNVKLLDDTNSIKTRLKIQDYIIKTSNEKYRNKYLDDFARFNIYEYIKQKKLDNKQNIEILDWALKEYFKKASNPEQIKILFESFSYEMINILTDSFSDFKKDLFNLIK